MNFCPDEKELVLEIFKTLGSGNTIKVAMGVVGFSALTLV